MDYGICLPNFTPGASPEGIDAAAGVAARLGWSTAWTTDHVLVPHDAADEYGQNYDAIQVLAWVGGRHPDLRLATSVIVVPQRNAVVLAKELATLDSLTGGRLIAGVGLGWNRGEFANLAMDHRFTVRGAYLDETIALWRHLWSGSREPFHGRFHTLDDFVFGPLPVQGANVPIVVGGRAAPALRRAGTVGDGYHSSVTSPAQYGERLPVIRAAADALAVEPGPRRVRRAGKQRLRDARHARGDGRRGPPVRGSRGRPPGALVRDDRSGRGGRACGTVRPRGGADGRGCVTDVVPR